MSDFTFLTKEQCLGDDKLDIFEKRGTKADITDFAILLGGITGSFDWYWTKSGHAAGSCACVVGSYGKIDVQYTGLRQGGGRPVFQLSGESSIPTNGKRGKRAGDGIFEVEYGYYPQKVVLKDMQDILEKNIKVELFQKQKILIQQMMFTLVIVEHYSNHEFIRNMNIMEKDM